MFQFIKSLFHINTNMSHTINLYQDTTTRKYYLSFTMPYNEDIIDNSNQFMLLNKQPTIIRQPYLHHIDIVIEVTNDDFAAQRILDYQL